MDPGNSALFHSFLQLSNDNGKLSMDSVIFFIPLIIERIHSQTANRTYLIRTDLITGLKGEEFTVYDDNGKEKTKPLAILRGKSSVVLYKTSISVLNEKVDQWQNRIVQKNYKFVGNKFLINYSSQEACVYEEFL